MKTTTTQRLFQWMGWTKRDELPLYDANSINPSPTYLPTPSPPHAMWYTNHNLNPTFTEFTFDSNGKNGQISPQAIDYSYDIENQNQSEPHQITEQHVRMHCCSFCKMIKRVLMLCHGRVD